MDMHLFWQFNQFKQCAVEVHNARIARNFGTLWTNIITLIIKNIFS